MRVWRSQAGITLVELVVVIVILGVMSAAIYPMLGNLLDITGAKGASEEVAGALRLARQHAITRGVNHCIVFAGAPTTFEIRQTSTDTTCDGAVVRSATPIGHQLAVVTFNPSSLTPTGTIVFNPVGSARNLPDPTAGQSLEVGKAAGQCPRMDVRLSLYGGVRVTSIPGC